MNSSIIEIGKDIADLRVPCAVFTALLKLQIRLATGGLRETIRIDGEEITFQRGSDARLTKLIEQYGRECERCKGQRRRYAAKIQFR